MASNRRLANSVVLAICALLAAVALLPVASGVATQVPAGCQEFPETGRTVCGRFLDYWLSHGGVALQGYPISDAFLEKSDVDGKTYSVQYFERAVFEYHAENQPPNEVLLSLLGAAAYSRKYPTGAPGQSPNTTAGSQSFPETGHHVGGTFLDYWQAHGGLSQFGYPVSDEFQEKSDLDSKTYTVQYFQRAVFELHPENQPPYDVLLSQLGTLSYRAKYPGGETAPGPPHPQGAIRTVFVIVMENHTWSQIKGNTSAPYINNKLLPQASHAEQYYNPPGNHPSEPNYLWLEAGTNFGIRDDSDPYSNHQSTPDHLVTLLDKRGISWKAYQEGISGALCPLSSGGHYAPKHNPMVFFDDVTGNNDPSSPYCIAHERPYGELASDLQNNTVARYNFIAPDLCNDMHDSSGCASSDSVRNGDTWLSKAIPAITGSQVYKDGGAIFITWDEGENKSDGPIGMLVLSPYAKGSGYSNSVHYTHSSTLRTWQEIFGVTPLLGDAAHSNDLSDLFRVFP